VPYKQDTLVDVLVPLAPEEVAHVPTFASQERGLQHYVEVDVPVPEAGGGSSHLERRYAGTRAVSPRRSPIGAVGAGLPPSTLKAFEALEELTAAVHSLQASMTCDRGAGTDSM